MEKPFFLLGFLHYIYIFMTSLVKNIFYGQLEGFDDLHM